MILNAFKKSIVLLLAMLLCLNFSLSASSELIIKNDDGVAYDLFTDDNGLITPLEDNNCSLGDGCIILDEGARSVNFDYLKQSGNIETSKHIKTLMVPSDDSLLGAISKILNPPPKGKDFTDTDLKGIKAIDDDNAVTESQYDPLLDYRVFYPINYFRFKIDYNLDIIANMDISWFGEYDEDANLEKVNMYVWTYGTLAPYWKWADEIVYNDTVSQKLTFNEKLYMSDEGYIDFIIVGTPEEKNDIPSTLYTDYVNATVEVTKGYLPNGYVTSEVIGPTSFEGWETILWEGSKPSSSADVKIQVLDEDDNVISQLDGNAEGFSSSPIDLSSLGKSYPKIKLRALFSSTDLEDTPKLYSWGVLWQTKEGFYDSFSYDFRIEESLGVNIDSGNIQVSEFYSNWPIFGKNPANTRSYIGPEATQGSNHTYWITNRNYKIGGGFRSPIVSNSRVYIGSTDHKIYAFNITIDKTVKHDPVDKSSASYHVDSSLAAADEFIIVGTCDYTSDSNKIYALNSKNLSNVSWSFSPESDGKICFTAAPTIANGRVYVTSHNGLFWNRPIISQLYAKINSLLWSILDPNSAILDSTSKLFVLDIYEGNETKDPVPLLSISLPAGSYSTPAIDNGIIYAGCENMEGNSLFAYDEITGDELWNASVGLIGRSSPVVAEADSGKVVYVLGREQTFLSIRGTDKIFALNAETGEMLWNVTIGENTTTRWNKFKNLNFDNLMALSSPIATPAVFEDTIYIMSTQGKVYALDINNKGKEKWTHNATGGLGAILPSYFTASPVVVANTLYIAAEDGGVYALDPDDGTVLWDHSIVDPQSSRPIPTYIFASPIVADGLVFVSANEIKLEFGEKTTTFGRMYAIGDYSTNTKGKVTSIPIHVQKGKWWNVFNATTENTDENNTIKFSILDENGEVLIGKDNLDGDDNDISNIPVNVIQLRAELEIGNDDEPLLPILTSWTIGWTDESEGPIFIKDTFNSGGGKEGWINEDLPVCSIEAKDEGSGLDLSKAKFKIEYLSSGNGNILTSSWYTATSEDISGEKQVTISADISSLDLDIYKLKNITFSIKDLAGNQAEESRHSFQMDTKVPVSSITNDFKREYNFDDQGIEIIANVINEVDESDEEEQASAIESVTLYYRSSIDEADLSKSEWKEDDTILSPYSWTFRIKTDIGMVSSYYQLVTVAKDLAGNEEKIVSSKISDAFLFDINKPEMTESLPSELNSLTAPFVTLSFSDDFELDSISYKPDSETSWTVIDSNIDDTTYESTWTVPQDYWDTIDPGEEQGHYIFFKVTDLAGNELVTTEENTPKVIKNETITDFYVDLSDFAEMQWDDKFTITATAADNIDVKSIKLYYRFASESNDLTGIEWKEYGEKTSEPYKWEFVASDGNGYYEFRTLTTDTSGNPYQSEPESVKVSLIPTSAATIMIILVLLLLTVTGFVLIKMKKKKE